MFVEYLPVKEVLLLWDRIVGFDSLQLLPVRENSLSPLRRATLYSQHLKANVFLYTGVGSSNICIPF
eukprot:SAG31_NODE_695_length_12765_cov_6.974499_6_plen_67_part_00